MHPPPLPRVPESWRLYGYAVAFLAWATVQGALAYYNALDQVPPDLVTGAAGVVDWLVGAGLLVATTHTGDRARVGRHVDLDGDGHAG